MKQVFFINPVAGKRDASDLLAPQIRQAAAALNLPEPEIVITRYAGHARALTEQFARDGVPAALYACGGDGTLNELVQGAAGHPQIAVGCVPCGSGNDYVRNFGEEGRRAFLDMAEQLQAVPVSVDLLSTSLGLGIDICAAGLDAQVAYGIPKFRRLPGCGGTMAYTLSILQVLFSRFGHQLRVTVDGESHTGTYMMTAICNGRLYGGGYMAAPYAAMDDGLLDMVLVQPIPRVKIAGFLSQYKSGKHLSRDGVVSDRFRPYLSFCRARSVEIEVLDGRPIIATVDGECQPVTQLCVEAKPASLTVLLPRPAMNVCGTITGAYRLPQEVEAAF